MRSSESELLHDYLAVANYFEAMADVVETNVVDAAAKASQKELELSDETRAHFDDLWHKVVWSVEKAAQAVYGNDADAAREVIEAKAEVDRLLEALQDRLLSRLTADAPKRMETFKVESTLAESLKRIYYFAKRIAKSIEHVDVQGAPSPKPTQDWTKLTTEGESAPI